MSNLIPYSFKAKVWQHSAPGGWYFVSMPKEMGKEIRTNLRWQEEGWGRLKAKASLGKTNWDTAIWFDTKADTYILPLKADIRKIEKITLNDELENNGFCLIDSKTQKVITELNPNKTNLNITPNRK